MADVCAAKEVMVQRLGSMSAVADTAFPLSVVTQIAKCPALKRCLVRAPDFLPESLADGNDIAKLSLLVSISNDYGISR